MSKSTYEQITESERHAIALGLQQKQSLRAIARALGRSPSTISREILRNAGGHGYVSRFAQQRCRIRHIHSRPQPKLLRPGVLFKQVCEYLRQHWSPQQIAGHLKKLHPHDRRQRVSHESIYTCIYAQPRGELKKELVACLRMAHAKRWPCSKGEDRRGEITDLVSIHVRPPEVEDRQLPGHWEETSSRGPQRQRHRHLGRAHHALSGAGQAATPQPGYGRTCAAGIQRQTQCNCQPDAQEPDLRPRPRDGRARQTHPEHRHEGVLL